MESSDFTTSHYFIRLVKKVCLKRKSSLFCSSGGEQERPVEMRRGAVVVNSGRSAEGVW
jgi:hypothetical protein